MWLWYLKEQRVGVANHSVKFLKPSVWSLICAYTLASSAMAAVLDALAPYVKKLITDMAEEEVSMLLGVPDEITKLGIKVENLEAYVADAERRRIDDVRVQRWVSKLKGALYDATNILELCHLDAEERREKARSGSCCGTMEERAPGCLLPLLFCLRNPCFAHRMGDRIKQLNANLDDIRKEMTDFGFVKLDAYQLWRQPSESTSHSRATTSLLDDTAVVGDAIEADTKSLVQELLTTESGVKVVSITAAGGMGKTTLARKIFNDEAIKSEFGRKIWLSVTERYDPDKLLGTAITQAGGEEDPHGDKQVLTQTLCTTLSSAGKFLMVLDDVWSHEAWSHVLRSPIIEAGRKQLGSRVIITTRNEGLVKEMGVDTYCLHRVKPLFNEDAWSLLKKQLPAQVLSLFHSHYCRSYSITVKNSGSG